MRNAGGFLHLKGKSFDHFNDAHRRVKPQRREAPQPGRIHSAGAVQGDDVRAEQSY
jgi:hypothetical protein